MSPQAGSLYRTRLHPVVQLRLLVCVPLMTLLIYGFGRFPGTYRAVREPWLPFVLFGVFCGLAVLPISIVELWAKTRALNALHKLGLSLFLGLFAAAWIYAVDLAGTHVFAIVSGSISGEEPHLFRFGMAPSSQFHTVTWIPFLAFWPAVLVAYPVFSTFFLRMLKFNTLVQVLIVWGGAIAVVHGLETTVDSRWGTPQKDFGTFVRWTGLACALILPIVLKLIDAFVEHGEHRERREEQAILDWDVTGTGEEEAP